MRICLLSAEYPPARGGVGDYTRLLASALARAGLEPCVLTSAWASATEPEPAGVRAHRRITTWRFGLWRQVAAFLQAERPDVLHVQYQTAAYGMHPAINLLPWRLRLGRLSVPVVTTFHDLRPPYLFPKAGAARHLPALALAAGSAAVVLVAREHWREAPLAWLHRLLPALADKTCVIPIGSNIPAAPPASYDRGAWRKSLGVAEGELLLAYFGFVNSSKGVDDLLLALAALRDRGQAVRLLLVGGGGTSNAADGAWQRKVEVMIAQLRLGGLVRRTGFTQPEEVSANLLAADLCVLPFRDGATFQRGTLLAALAHGLPILSTAPPGGAAETGPLPQTWQEKARLAHGENVWLVPPRQPAALAEAVARLGEDADLRSRLARGAALLGAGITWDGIARRHAELYEGVADVR